MPIHGMGFRVGPPEWVGDDMVARPDVLDQRAAAAAVVNDYFWDTTPTPVTIRYSWLSPAVRFRADQPINDPTISTSGAGGTARVANATSINQYGDFGQPVTLATAVTADADCLAAWFTTSYSGFRMRFPSLTINLLNSALTPQDVATVLSVKIGDRLLIPDAPATWPEGTKTAMVEGIERQVLIDRCRYVTFNTSPVIGTNPGTPGPYFRWGSSVWASSTDLIPF